MIKHGPVDGVVLVINFMGTVLTIFSLVVMVLLILTQNIFGIIIRLASQ